MKQLFGTPGPDSTPPAISAADDQTAEVERLRDAALNCESAGQWLDAADLYRRLGELQPEQPGWLKDLGFVLSEAEEWEAALAIYGQVIAQLPEDANAHYNSGRMLSELDRIAEAQAMLERAVELKADHSQALLYLGVLRHKAGDDNAAIACMQRAIDADPDFHFGFFNMAISQVALGDLEAAATSLQSCTKILQQSQPVVLAMPPHKFLHDLEQYEFLAEDGDEQMREIARDWRLLYEQQGLAEYEQGPEWLQGQVDLNETAPPGVQMAAYRTLRRHEEPRLAHALNPELDFDAIEEEFFSASIPAVAIDNILSTEALHAVQNFCQRNTFWHNIKPGYLGAYLQDGFYTPLLFQLASELRQQLPRILGPHQWRNMWAYKHDRNHGGIAVHADSAAVNVNYWLTPDEANLLPEKGGLLVWDKAAPPDWNFRKLNADEGAINNFLEASGAEPVRFPFRENRALIFRSDLFHRTDEVKFKPGYTNRRLNLTMLYGDREDIQL